MNRKLYVGNLNFNTTEDELRDLFGQVAPVASVSMIMDRETGRPRGFAFVEMETSEGPAGHRQAEQPRGCSAHHHVNEARPKTEGGVAWTAASTATAVVWRQSSSLLVLAEIRKKRARCFGHRALLFPIGAIGLRSCFDVPRCGLGRGDGTEA
jgi:hypothetical protein